MPPVNPFRGRDSVWFVPRSRRPVELASDDRNSRATPSRTAPSPRSVLATRFRRSVPGSPYAPASYPVPFIPVASSIVST